MSIEQVIADQTAALEKQTAAILGLTAAIVSASSGSVAAAANVASIQEASASAKTTKKTATKEVPAETTETEPDAETAAEDDGLPEGKRDPDFFLAHVAPTLKELADINVKKLGEINETFGNRKAGLIEPAKWGYLVQKVRQELDRLVADESVI